MTAIATRIMRRPRPRRRKPQGPPPREAAPPGPPDYRHVSPPALLPGIAAPHSPSSCFRFLSLPADSSGVRSPVAIAPPRRNPSVLSAGRCAEPPAAPVSTLPSRPWPKRGPVKEKAPTESPGGPQQHCPSRIGQQEKLRGARRGRPDVPRPVPHGRRNASSSRHRSANIHALVRSQGQITRLSGSGIGIWSGSAAPGSGTSAIECTANCGPLPMHRFSKSLSGDRPGLRQAVHVGPAGKRHNGRWPRQVLHVLRGRARCRGAPRTSSSMSRSAGLSFVPQPSED